MTFADPPAATVPLVALAVKTPFPVLSPLHVRRLFPLLLRVSVVVVLVPTVTFPNAIVPDSPMMRVAETGAAVPVPETVVVLVPLVASLVTVSVLL